MSINEAESRSSAIDGQGNPGWMVSRTGYDTNGRGAIPLPHLREKKRNYESRASW
jgi:hypothetical protein